MLCPSPTCSPFSGGCNYVSQGFLSGSFFFLFFSPPTPLLPECCGADQTQERKPTLRAGRARDTHGCFNGPLACGKPRTCPRAHGILGEPTIPDGLSKAPKVPKSETFGDFLVLVFLLLPVSALVRSSKACGFLIAARAAAFSPYF